MLSRVKGWTNGQPTRKLDGILQELIPLEQRGKVTRFLNSTEDVNKLGGLVEEIRDIMMDYQVCTHFCSSNLALCPY